MPADRRHLLEQYRFVEVARKVVGVGSVGTRAWIALMAGKDDTDTLFLQVKEADSSVLAATAGDTELRQPGRPGGRGQRLMQAASDIFLGWTGTGPDGGDYYVRQLRDMKISADSRR